MKYIIMCGGHYAGWEKPRQLTVIQGEEIVARTIRLLRENGIEDISISTDSPAFEKFGLPILTHENDYGFDGQVKGCWCNAFYPTDEPTCYIFGDVVFSPNAIKTIIETETNDIMFFGSAPPYSKDYIKPHAEPFALKVVNNQHLRDSVEEAKRLNSLGKFGRSPIMWELWQVIKGTPINKIDFTNYVVINDYTCDVDSEKDAELFEKIKL